MLGWVLSGICLSPRSPGSRTHSLALSLSNEDVFTEKPSRCGQMPRTPPSSPGERRLMRAGVSKSAFSIFPTYLYSSRAPPLFKRFYF